MSETSLKDPALFFSPMGNVVFYGPRHFPVSVNATSLPESPRGKVGD